MRVISWLPGELSAAEEDLCSMVGWLVGFELVQYALKHDRTAYRNIPCSCMCSGSLYTVYSLIQQSTEQLVLPAIWSALHTETFKFVKVCFNRITKIGDASQSSDDLCFIVLNCFLRLLIIRLCIFNVGRYSPVTSCCVYISYQRTCQLLHRASFGS